MSNIGRDQQAGQEPSFGPPFVSAPSLSPINEQLPHAAVSDQGPVLYVGRPLENPQTVASLDDLEVHLRRLRVGLIVRVMPGLVYLSSGGLVDAAAAGPDLRRALYTRGRDVFADRPRPVGRDVAAHAAAAIMEDIHGRDDFPRARDPLELRVENVYWHKLNRPQDRELGRAVVGLMASFRGPDLDVIAAEDDAFMPYRWLNPDREPRRTPHPSGAKNDLRRVELLRLVQSPSEQGPLPALRELRQLSLIRRDKKDVLRFSRIRSVRRQQV